MAPWIFLNDWKKRIWYLTLIWAKLWGGNLGLKRKGGSGEVAGIFKVDVRSGVKDAKLHDKGGNANEKAKRKGGEKGLSIREEIEGRRW